MSEGVRAAEVLAQAKINLRLRMLAREEAGHHQLETLLLRLALGDTVRVRRSATRSLDVRGDVDLSAIGAPERNLAWRAAAAYLEARADSGGFAIEIDKRIPVGGGLGGGSADAGAVLRCLDAMSPSPLGEGALLALAAPLGADVPFLTSAHAYALAWGRGERMLALDPPERREVALALPGVSVNTAAAYGWLAEARRAAGGTPPEPIALDVWSLSTWSIIATLATNDFESVVAQRHPAIADALSALRRVGTFEIAMMSGSGSTLFGVVGPGADVRVSAASAALGTRPPWHVTTSTAVRVEPVRLID